MKPLLSILTIALLATSASAIDFTFKTTLEDGSFFRGGFGGEDDGAGGIDISYDFASYASYYNSGGALVKSPIFDAAISGYARLDGQPQGLRLFLNFDSGGMDNDVVFVIQSQIAYFYYDNYGSPYSIGGKMATWELSSELGSTFYQFPVSDTTPTLALLSLGLLGLAGTKRAVRK